MRPSTAESSPRPGLIGAALVWTLLAWGCGDRRASAEGESCARTADCAEPLRCVDRTCLAPARARHLIEARRGPAVPDGPATTDRAPPLGQGPTATETPAGGAAPASAADAPGGAGRP